MPAQSAQPGCRAVREGPGKLPALETSLRLRGASLRGMRQRGRVVSGEGKGPGVRWGLT